MNKGEKNIHSIRSEYTLSNLRKKDLLISPILQFKKWLDEAILAKVNEPTAMTISTIGEEGFPESRIVLLKSIEKDDFTFFTNYQSNKSIEININNKIALTFFWPEIQRQVRIKGIASKTTEKISDQYFETRPKASQLGAWASKQSNKITSRKQLEDAYYHFQEVFNEKEIPRPKHWGGYIVKPVSIEFWQGRENRLHDRFLYSLVDTNWVVKRLAP